MVPEVSAEPFVAQRERSRGSTELAPPLTTDRLGLPLNKSRIAPVLSPRAGTFAYLLPWVTLLGCEREAALETRPRSHANFGGAHLVVDRKSTRLNSSH